MNKSIAKAILALLLMAFASAASAQVCVVNGLFPPGAIRPICPVQGAPGAPCACLNYMTGMYNQGHIENLLRPEAYNNQSSSDELSNMPAGLLTERFPSATYQVDDMQGAVLCASMTAQQTQVDTNSFLSCTKGALVLDKDSMALVNCAEQSADIEIFGKCAAQNLIGSKITGDELRLTNCAVQAIKGEQGFMGCASNAFIGNNLNRQQQALLQCTKNHREFNEDLLFCSGKALYGDQLSPNTLAATACAIGSRGSPSKFTTCAAKAFLKIKLTPEQEIGLRCIATSGGQPYAAASCAAAQLTARELEKCATNGIGGRKGCFGDNNDLVGKNGFVVRNIKQLAGGPNSMINNPLQIMGGGNSLANNPRQILGGEKSAPNIILKQIPSPPPINIGKIGKHKVCIPWC